MLIIGAGVAGLACIASLPSQRDTLLLEGDTDIGGLLRVYRFGDYVFDTVPHVLFFRDKRVLAALRRLLPVPFREFRRTNVIWQDGNIIAYPYQFNACDLPPHIRHECIDGMRAIAPGYRDSGTSFKEWLLAQFGHGFYAHFFKPYNEKLYGVSLSELEAGPLKWTIPRNNRQGVMSGAERPHPPPTQLLYYPAGRRGISTIIDSLAEPRLGNILTQQRVDGIDVSRREVRTTTGHKFRYRKLVSTLPLPQLIENILHAPQTVRAHARKLRAIGIYVIRVGSRDTGPGLRNIWTYFPDPEVPFYRLTRLEHISPDLCRRGATSILLESTRADPPSRDEIVRYLVRLGVLNSSEIDHFSVAHIPCAYVLFLQGFREALQEVRRFLDHSGVITAGRYGGWMYADIEMALKSGISAARHALEPGETLSDGPLLPINLST